MSILGDIYFGNINPSARSYSPGSRSEKLSKLIADGISKIEEDLSPSGREFFSHWLDMNGELQMLDNADAFQSGCRFAARFLIEAFFNGSEAEKAAE